MSERLDVAPVADDELEELFDLFVANREYLALTEGSGGEPGRYDRGMCERDVAVARMDPVRHLEGVRLRESSTLVGVLDWIEEHPRERVPWLGLVLVDPRHQRQGIASEAIRDLARRLREHGATTLRAAVLPGNPRGAALLESVGFVAIGERDFRSAAATTAAVFELALSDAARRPTRTGTIEE